MRLSFQKAVFLCSSLDPLDHQSGIITITPQSQLLVRDTENISVDIDHTCLIPVELD